MFSGRKGVGTSKGPGSPSGCQNIRTASASDSVTHALQAATDVLLDLPVGLALGEGGALVPGLLALGERDLDLGPAVLEVERERDDREALLVHAPLDLVDLIAV